MLLALAPRLGGAADFEYKAGTAVFGQARALALEDRRGERAIVAEAEFAITRATADFVGVQLMRDYDLRREALVVRGAAAGTGRSQDLTTAIAAALGKLEPAVVRFGGGGLSVEDARGRCRAAVSEDGALRFEGCGGGEVVRSPIRAAFQTIEPEHGLERRGETAPLYPVQAIALGKQAVILGLGGAVPPGRFRGARLIVVPFANDNTPLPEDARVEKRIREVLARVGR